MINSLSNILFSVLLVVSTSAVAQKMNLVSGSLKEFKDVASFDIKFTYDSMIIGRGVPEKEYLDKIKNRWEVREPGKGQAFEKMWFESRAKLYEPAFIRNFEDYSLKKLNDENAKYTLLLKTTRTEGGFDFGVHGKEAIIAGELLIVESADNNKVKAKIVFYDGRGSNNTGGDFNMDSRIKSAYNGTGKWLGIYFRKKAK
jgi:hypothetical protein